MPPRFYVLRIHRHGSLTTLHRSQRQADRMVTLARLLPSTILTIAGTYTGATP